MSPRKVQIFVVNGLIAVLEAPSHTITGNTIIIHINSYIPLTLTAVVFGR